ncbi:MAG: sulfite exporter TauE/SafE family protein, partial [Deltaproteobacteria bacterium]|nr:sulfite exporter TauE/SafE family protein [Deltaproteobacteria bacterium]
MHLGYKNVFRDPLGYPHWKANNLTVETAPAELTGMKRQPEAPGVLYGWAMIWTLLGIFAGGMALNLTPCVYPLIPVTISYFGGRSGKRQLIGHGLCYIGGLSITSSILGVVAALTGGLMGAMLQNPLVLVFVAAILVLMATSLFGMWEIRLPGGLMQAASKTYAGYLGTFFMGLTMGIVAAPCIGPFVLGLLTWVAGMGSAWLGFIVFFTLSLGLGLPLFFLAIFSGNLNRLPRSGEWMLWVRKLMGWVLVGMAVYFIRPVLPKTAGVFFSAAVTLAAGLHLGWIDKTKANFSAFEWIRTVVGITAVVAATLLVGNWFMQGPGVTWNT